LGLLYRLYLALTIKFFWSAWHWENTYLALSKRNTEKKQDITVYIDLRNIGSTGGLYSDESIPFAERGTRLLMDTLAAVHDEILSEATEPQTNLDLSLLAKPLNDLANAITEVTITSSTIDQETAEDLSSSRSQNESCRANLSI